MSPETFLSATAEDPQAVLEYLTFLESENMRMSRKLIAIGETLMSMRSVSDEAAYTITIRPHVLVKHAELEIEVCIFR